MAYTPPDGGNIITNATGAYTPPDGGNIITGELPPSIIPEGSRTLVVPWGESPLVAKNSAFGWRTPRSVEMSMAIGWKTGGVAATGVAVPWVGSLPKKTRSVSSPWKRLRTVEQRRQVLWENSEMVARSVAVPFITPPTRNRLLVVSYRQNQPVVGIGKIVRWFNPPSKGVPHHTVWGPKFYQEICWRTYQPPPGGQIVTDMRTPISQVDDGVNINILFDKYTYDRRCKWREPSGHRDVYFYRPPAPIPTGPWATVYTMLNSAFLTRLPDRTPIDTTGLTIGTDWDSVYWTLKANVGSDAALALLEPTEEGPALVEAAINGHLWNFQVDNWTKDEAFFNKIRSNDGRSISAQLGAPMAEIRTYTETEARTAQQLMAYELENTGWSVVFEGLDDWLVPGGIHCYQDQTPMQVIKAIADTCRAIVQTDMVTQTIRIKPRYKVPPWQLSTATPDFIIPASMAAKTGGGSDTRPFYNAVYVAGEAGGISATVTRQGSAGDLLAPMVTSKLITAVEAARALGIAVLGTSGKWSKHRIELPVFTPPAVPGIIPPGSIIEYNLGTSSWRGYVSAVSVTAPRTRDGLKVRQVIDVERYHGN